jgi:hypothetical protein
MSHLQLSRDFASKVKNKTIWVYDNGKLLINNPYPSFALAMKAIGYSKSSVCARKSLDTGKIIGGRYTFYSNPL